MENLLRAGSGSSKAGANGGHADSLKGWMQMTKQMITEHIGRAKYEASEFMNKTGEGITAGCRCILVISILGLLMTARLLGLLDEQLGERTTSAL